LKNVLTIAGSDSLAGGGLQADLKTFEELDVFGVSALTSIVSVMTDKLLIHQIEASVIEQQLDSIFGNLQIDYLKTGLIGDLPTLKLVTKKLQQYPQIKVVVDPVMVFKEAQTAIKADYLEFFCKEFLPLAYVVTPNLAEAAQLSGIGIIESQAQMQRAALKIQALGCQNIVIKGGSRLSGTLAIDYAKLGKKEYWLQGPKIQQQTIDGAGCTFSAAITAQLAKGEPLIEAITFAKKFVYLGIADGQVVNSKLGNVWQGAYRQRRLTDET